MSDCFFGSPPIHYLVLYDNIVFVFLANKYSLSLSLSLSTSIITAYSIARVVIVLPVVPLFQPFGSWSHTYWKINKKANKRKCTCLLLE